jgi:hypothetical protein
MRLILSLHCRQASLLFPWSQFTLDGIAITCARASIVRAWHPLLPTSAFMQLCDEPILAEFRHRNGLSKNFILT